MVTLAPLLYLVAAICFIMALRGLSHPESSRRGLMYGIGGMALAIVTTLLTPHMASLWLIAIGIAIGGTIGASWWRRSTPSSSSPPSTSSAALSSAGAC